MKNGTEIKVKKFTPLAVSILWVLFAVPGLIVFLSKCFPQEITYWNIFRGLVTIFFFVIVTVCVLIWGIISVDN